VTLLLPTDGCPGCVRPVPVHPFLSYPLHPVKGPVWSWYQCPSCGDRWWSSWHIGAWTLPCPGCGLCDQAGEGAA
jgi:hypothetical protein